jgi:hypothetical protein
VRAAIFASLIPAPDTDEERERLLKLEKPPLPPLPPEPKEEGEEGQIITPPPPPPPPPPAVYQSVTIETPVAWRQWYDFYQAVIQPLVEAGGEVHLHLRLEASGEIDANLVDLRG